LKHAGEKSQKRIQGKMIWVAVREEKMATIKKATEYDLLRLFMSEMEDRGVTRTMVNISLDQSIVEALSNKFKVTTNLRELHQLADKCLAHQWLEHMFMGAKYSSLTLTASGQGVVRSLQIKEKTKAKRTILKQFSDFIEDHKGIFAAIGVLIAILGLLIKLGA